MYNPDYARMYIERTLLSPYTVYKNETIAATLGNFEPKPNIVLDIGGNVSGIIKLPGSLRYQLEKQGINYTGLDLHHSYFDPHFARSLNQPEHEIYSNVSGIVGDALNLPIAEEGNFDTVVCADVIEHIADPARALREIYRILPVDGNAIIIVPSLYKLDAVHLPHILERRFSTHENKLTNPEWIELIESAKFKVNDLLSRPIGIASGLLYLSWLNPDYVPSRVDANSPEVFSTKAELFKTVKNHVSRADPEIDSLILSNPEIANRLFELLCIGDIQEIMEVVKEYCSNSATFQTMPKGVDSLNKFVASFESSNIDHRTLGTLTQTFRRAGKDSRQAAVNFLGNSTLLVLNKSR